MEALTDGKIFTDINAFKEGSAVISDKQGNLLFYTDGMSVWNQNHQVMPNGRNLDGHWSATQTALIVPKPGSTHLYYIFTTDERGNFSPSNEGLRFSIVDMQLDNGRGDILTDKKNVPLFPGSGEQLTAVKHTNNKDLWILARRHQGNSILAFQLSKDGLAAPVESQISFKPSKNDFVGYLKASPDGLKLAQAFYGSRVVEVYAFNPATGVVSDPVTLQADEFFNVYGVEFSPNGNLLYLSSGASFEGPPPSRVYQLNLQAASASEILSSKILLLERPVTSRQNSVGALQLGPDGRLYIAQREDYLDVITKPNTPGIACEYVSNAVHLKGKKSEMGLPNFPPYLFFTCEDVAIDLGPDMALCFGEKVILDPRLPNANLTWSDGSTSPTLTVSAPGTYSVKASVYGCEVYDTVTVAYLQEIKANLGPDFYFCHSTPIVLQATESDATYLWSDGSDQPTLNVTQPGLIWLEISKNGCTVRDSILIKERRSPSADLGGNRLICEGESFILDVAQPEMSYLWSDGSTSSSIMVSQPGEYRVQVSNGCEIAVDTITVQTENCDCNLTLPNIFTPNNDGKNDYFFIPVHQNIGNINLKVYNRWGGQVAELNNQQEVWDGKGATDGVYFYIFSYECLQNTILSRKVIRGTITLIR